MLYSPKWRNEKGLFVFVFGFPIFNILVFLASLLLIWILKKILNALFGFCHLTNERKWRIWLGIGYIGCLLFGFLPRIRALWAGDLKGDLLITINVSMLLECKRCDLGYSTYRTPRILKEYFLQLQSLLILPRP
ncbi:hypothetical protein L5515_003364 [Caenorhabditis briggsae]|uniref:Uncharacterized protein n=1 Tax=Caenorhabditis briggsae TaxID=6238 RepID=A0AAE9JBV8_CAEBR|nr:hypothetical protein L5515_003364 [Caenorhabditis briggsae]